MKLGATVISRNDGYGGDQPLKFTYCLTALLAACDEVVYVDWNSERSLIEEVHAALPKTGKLRAITITPAMASELTQHSLDTQLCVEVLARNIGLRRLNTDYLISTNGDIMVLDRASIERGIIDDKTFHCIARRETDFKTIQHHLGPSGRKLVDGGEDIQARLRWLDENLSTFQQHGSGSPLGAADPWSLITCPGDFQLASREVWYGIKGFEESLLMRGYTDSNVQRKAVDAGFKLALVRDIPVFHFAHYPNTGACGGTHNSGWNDADKSLFKFAGTTNQDNWGFADREFPTEII